MPSALRVCALDLDGTLVDSQHHIVAAMAAAFIQEGLPEPEAEQVRQVVGLPLDVAVGQLAPEVGGLQIERMGQTYRDAYFDAKARSGETEPLFPGALPALDALESAGWLLAIVTGKGRRGLIEVLEAHGIRSRFVSLKSADDGPGKPDPTLLLEVVAETGVERARCLMVGDTVFDMKMAGNARIPALGVSWGYHGREQLRAEGARVILERFDDLPRAAEDLIG